MVARGPLVDPSAKIMVPSKMYKRGLTEVRFIRADLHEDVRGRLAVFDRDTLPFAPVRVFSISDVPAGTVRSGRKLSCEEFVWAVAGSCRLKTLINGFENLFTLDDRNQGISLPVDTFVELTNFAPGTLLLVLASASYSETEK